MHPRALSAVRRNTLARHSNRRRLASEITCLEPLWRARVARPDLPLLPPRPRSSSNLHSTRCLPARLPFKDLLPLPRHQRSSSRPSSSIPRDRGRLDFRRSLRRPRRLLALVIEAALGVPPQAVQRLLRSTRPCPTLARDSRRKFPPIRLPTTLACSSTRRPQARPRRTPSATSTRSACPLTQRR